MRETAREISQFVAGMTFGEFAEHALVRRAVERDLEVIGEAAAHVSAEFREAHPEIAFAPIVAQRNVLAHQYGDIDYRRLWRVVIDDLAVLMGQLEALL